MATTARRKRPAKQQRNQKLEEQLKEQLKEQRELTQLVSQLKEENLQYNDQLTRQLTSLHQEFSEIKEIMSKLKPTNNKRGSFGKRSKPVPVQVEPEPPAKPKSGFSLEEVLPLLPDVLPLLPYLGGVIPQLNGEKMADALKLFSNPAVTSMIQQFIANGLPKIEQPVEQNKRRKLLS